jgi:hypothetical protein
MVSPGTRMRVLEEENRGRLFGLPMGLGRVKVWLVLSLEESFGEEGDEGGRPSSSSSESDGARMVIAMAFEAVE